MIGIKKCGGLIFGGLIFGIIRYITKDLIPIKEIILKLQGQQTNEHNEHVNNVRSAEFNLICEQNCIYIFI